MPTLIPPCASIFNALTASPTDKFYRTEHTLANKFLELERRIPSYRKAEFRQNNAIDALVDFRNTNSAVAIMDTTDIRNNVAERRLRLRKWSAVVGDVLCSIPTFKFVFSLAIGLKMGLAAVLLLGGVTSFLLLGTAISNKIDTNRLQSNNQMIRIGRQILALLPISFIPALSFLLVFLNAGDPMNLLWGGLAIMALYLNYNAAQYAREYELMYNSKEARKQLDILRYEEKKARLGFENEISHSSDFRQKITMLAIELRKQYENFSEDKPKMTIPTRFIFTLNNSIFDSVQVFPLPTHMQKQLPPIDSEAETFLQFWDDSNPANYGQVSQSNGKVKTGGGNLGSSQPGSETHSTSKGTESGSREDQDGGPSTNDTFSANGTKDSGPPEEKRSFGSTFNPNHRYI